MPAARRAVCRTILLRKRVAAAAYSRHDRQQVRHPPRVRHADPVFDAARQAMFTLDVVTKCLRCVPDKQAAR